MSPEGGQPSLLKAERGGQSLAKGLGQVFLRILCEKGCTCPEALAEALTSVRRFPGGAGAVRGGILCALRTLLVFCCWESMPL